LREVLTRTHLQGILVHGDSVLYVLPPVALETVAERISEIVHRSGPVLPGSERSAHLGRSFEEHESLFEGCPALDIG
jgi:hypothetical protein